MIDSLDCTSCSSSSCREMGNGKAYLGDKPGQNCGRKKGKLVYNEVTSDLSLHSGRSYLPGYSSTFSNYSSSKLLY